MSTTDTAAAQLDPATVGLPTFEVSRPASFLAGLADSVAANADRVAVTDGTISLTYAQLDRSTSALATLLSERLREDDHTGAGVGAEPGGATVPVGILLGHNANVMRSVVSLAKAGRLIVILDAHLPAARIQHIFSLANIADVITDAENADLAAELAAGRAGGPASVHRIETLLADAQPIVDGDAPIAPVPGAERTDDDPFVIVFTSGSTGMPKGVVMSQKMVLLEASASGPFIDVQPGDEMSALLPFSFAAGWATMMLSILRGASSHVLDARDAGVQGIADWVQRDGITYFISTPHLIRGFGAQFDPATEQRLRSVRKILTSGEAVTGPDVAGLLPLVHPEATYRNGVGSSENLTWTVHAITAKDPIPTGPVPAGRVNANHEIRIVREDGSLADIGESGELICIAECVTSGYWGQPDLTASRAGVHTDGRPTWRQGDLARFDADGLMTLLGRIDDAVKIRGYLVEPTEIEATILQIDAILETSVIAIKEEGQTARLAAYVVTREGRRQPSQAEIRKHLREKLPSYMVPAAIVPMITLPRNERGKVDRTQLPIPAAPARITRPTTGVPAAPVRLGSAKPGLEAAPAPAAPVSPAPAVSSAPPVSSATRLDEVLAEDAVSIDYEAIPEGAQWELVIAQIWAEVLGLPTVGPDDDFTELGGDSLSSEEMLAIVDKRIGVDLRSADLLSNPTVRLFSQRVRAGAAAVPSHPDITKLSEGDGSAKPMFCIAGAGALALSFLPLARHFTDRDVYAFQQHGMERRAVPDWTIRAQAQRYLELMRIVQPHGPYTLVGHSLGGIVAVEMAAMLQAAGEHVDNVVLLDTYLPQNTAGSIELEFGKLSQEQMHEAPAAFGKVKDVVDKQVRKVLPGGFSQLKRINRRFRAYGAGVIPWKGQQQFDAFFDQAVLVAKKHRMPEYSGPATYVIADNNPDTPAAWSRHLTGSLATVRVKGEHTSIMREPHIGVLADAIRDAMASASAELTSGS
jgi:acyl-coenzyme A synthetase/AMP-(fatty) acid ligase/thioesterase domain-containing protein/acyl carrier protein